MKSTEEIYIWNRKSKYNRNQRILIVKCIKPGTIQKLWSKPLNHFVNWTIKRYKNVINEYCMFRRKYLPKFIFAPFSLVVVRMTNSNGNFLIWINIQKLMILDGTGFTERRLAHDIYIFTFPCACVAMKKKGISNSIFMYWTNE